MMTSLTTGLPIDLSALRAPAPSRRESSTSFADDLSSASESIAPDEPSPSPAPDRCGAPTPADPPAQQRAERRDERRDERHDARDDARDEQREEHRDVAGAERRDERRDARHDDRDERRDTRRAGRRDDRRDDRRAAVDRVRTALAHGKPQADDETAATSDAAAKGDAAATRDLIADASSNVRADGSEAKTAPLEPAAALPSTTEFAARADAAAAPDARHAHALDALRQHLAAARGSDAGPARVDAHARDGAGRVEAAHARVTDADADADAATSTLDAAMRTAPLVEAQPRVRSAARGIADGVESASSRRVEADTTAASAAADRAAADPSTRADALPAWRDAFTMPAPQASIGAAHAGPIGAVHAASGSAATAASSTVTEQTIAAAPGSAEFTRALSSQVTLWARDGTQEARLQLNPAELGPVTVFIAIDGAQARVDFHAHAAATRDAIEASMPSLAGALGEQGLELSGGGVFDRSGRDASAQGQPQARPSSSAARDGGHDVGVGARGTAMTARSVTPRGLVDLVA